MRKPRQRRLTVTVNVWRVGNGRIIIFFFVADIQCACRFPKSTKRPINVQRTWFTPHALFTHYDPWLGIPYYNLTPPVPHEEDTPYYSPPGDALCSSVGFCPWNPHQCTVDLFENGISHYSLILEINTYH